MMFFEDPQRPERVRIEVGEDHKKETDTLTSNKTKEPQPPEEQTDIEVGVKGQEEVRGKVKVETKGKTESVRVEGKRDNRPTEGHKSGRLRRTPDCDDDP